MRLTFIKGIICILFVSLMLGLGFTQVIKGNYYYSLSRRNYIRLIPERGIRGSIYDANGNVLSEDVLSLNISVVPQEVVDKDELIQGLCKILGRDKDQLLKIYKSEYVSPFSPIVLVKNISKEDAIRVSERKSSLSGIFVQRVPVRNYAYANSVAHVLGYVNQINEAKFSKLKKYGFSLKDRVGFGGVEELFDSYIRGEDGGRQIQVDSLGHQVKLLGIKKPMRGRDVTLTVDARVQKIASDLLANKKGSVVIMDPSSGKILTLASGPTFNPEIFSKSDSAEVSKLLQDKSSPFLNRAISGQYPLGSVFKIAVALTGLETGQINPERRFFCNKVFTLGSASFKCWSQHGSQNLREAIAHSCNVYFYNTGQLIGVNKIYQYAQNLGFGALTGIELPFENKGALPNPEWKRKTLKETWYEGDTVNLSIGQGNFLCTPIQAARFMSAVVNGGYLVRPYIVKNIEGVDVSGESRVNLNFNEGNLNFLKSAMIDVIRLPDGTAHKAVVESITFGGKTGTAQAPGGAHGWFVGFAPMNQPKVVISVMLENVGSGAYAAELAGKILDEMVKQNLI